VLRGDGGTTVTFGNDSVLASNDGDELPTVVCRLGRVPVGLPELIVIEGGRWFEEGEGDGDLDRCELWLEWLLGELFTNFDKKLGAMSPNS